MKSMTFSATQWVWDASRHVNDGHHPILIEQCIQRDGSFLYAIRQTGGCMDAKGNWILEPIPSERSDEFMQRFRFKTWNDAAVAIEKYAKPNGRFCVYGVSK